MRHLATAALYVAFAITTSFFFYGQAAEVSCYAPDVPRPFF